MGRNLWRNAQHSATLLLKRSVCLLQREAYEDDWVFFFSITRIYAVDTRLYLFGESEYRETTSDQP